MQGRSLSKLTRMLALSLLSIVMMMSSAIFVGETKAAGITRHYAGATVGGCPLFPSNNIWNTDISNLPVDPNSANYIAAIGLSGHLHPDFGSGLYNGGPIGIPYVVVPGSQPGVPVSFQYASESDPGPYPIPSNAPVEGGPQSNGDRHVIVVDSGNCKDYEMFAAYPQSNGIWQAGSGAVFSLTSNALRPSTWTSADAAGLPILPGLVRYDEVATGVISHSIRFTVNQTRNTFIWPARHEASSSSDPNLPPMGLRLRLKANVNISSFSPINQIILTALKHYGMFVADNGASWFISGAPDNRWNNDDLHALTTIPGSDFEVVNESSLEVNPNSAQAAGVAAPQPSPTPKHTATLTPSRTTTVSATPTLHPREALTAEPPRIAVKGNQASTSDNNTSTTGPNLTPVALGGVVALLAILGIWVGLKRTKRRQRE